MYFPQMILGVCNKNCHLLKWQNMLVKSPVQWFLLLKRNCHKIEVNCIQNDHTDQTNSWMEKMEKGPKIRVNTSKIPPKWPSGRILTGPFNLFSNFSLFSWVCVICAVNKSVDINQLEGFFEPLWRSKAFISKFKCMFN